MHDYHAVEALLDRITTELTGGERVVRVTIRVGPGLSPEALEQAYEILTKDTPLQGSSLVIEQRHDERECPACGEWWTVTPDNLAGHSLVCPSCGALSSLEGSAGMELVGIATGGTP